MISAAVLKRAYLFKDLSEADLVVIASAAREEEYGPEEFIYRKGEPGLTFYVILSGEVELVVGGQKDFLCVTGHISAGGHFGEVSLLTGKPRSLSVRTLNNVRVLAFDQDVFETVLLVNQSLHRTLDKALAERLSLASQGVHEFGEIIEPLSPAAYLPGEERVPSEDKTRQVEALHDLQLAKSITKQIETHAASNQPLIIVGESGTGRRLVAKQVHLQSERKQEPYLEFDLRQFDPWIWEGKLFGYEHDAFPYSTGRQLGVFEQLTNGTVVLCHAELLSNALQQKLVEAVRKGKFSAADGRAEHPFKVRLILITTSDLSTLEKEAAYLHELVSLLEGHVFYLPPLREHKRDIPKLVDYYIMRYSQELSKKIAKISPEALGLLLKYDWPGNLTELANVIHRAVMVTQRNEIISEQILLGMSRPEGKLVYNLLRIPKIRQLVEHKFFPVLPRIVIGVFFLIGILALFLGPQEPEKNLGITLSWYVGWPLLIVSFFFLPRFWCSVCTLSAPGKLIQRIIKPKRRVPPVIVAHSGWLMAFLCLIVFWVEMVWNAYGNPLLTGGILLAVASGSLVFSALFERYAWCRYLCPLGALNAVFSMPSILELRANRQMCDNQCQDHACYRGTEDSPGCPMYRHPFLVDNNKDCILCCRCIKNCRLRSIQLNLRLAPQELWTIQAPQQAYSFLIIALGAIFFLLAGHGAFQQLNRSFSIFAIADADVSAAINGTLIFWGIIAAGWCGYSLLCWLQGVISDSSYQEVRVLLAYGLIPLILGGYLAFYVRMFVHGAWRLVPNFLLLFGIDTRVGEIHLLSPQGVATVLNIFILGGLAASLYALYKICGRLEAARPALKDVAIPFIFALAIGTAYLNAI